MEIETVFKTITTIERERATAERLAFLAVSGMPPETMDRAEPIAVIVDELRYALSRKPANKNPFLSDVREVCRNGFGVWF